MKRGEVRLADLSPRTGSEQRGRRPVVVLSHDSFNKSPNWRSVIVIPLSTSSARGRRGPTAIPLARGTANLKKDSVALCHQITTFDRAKLGSLVGTLPARALELVELGTKAALGLL